VRAVPAVCFDLLRAFEQGPIGGFAGQIYEDPAGHATIGWGHRLTPLDAFAGVTITRKEADDLAEHDLNIAGAAVSRYVSAEVLPTLTDGQYGALVDFTFNMGAVPFLGSSMLRLINAGKLDLVAAEFPRWVYAGGKIMPGLERRREWERTLWLTGALPLAGKVPIAS
jgi:lysozyme